LEEQVTGELLDELSSWDALRAALPVGTVSGAPKVSTVFSQQLKFMSLSIQIVQNLCTPFTDVSRCKSLKFSIPIKGSY
jgi:hypothetical protein